MKYAIAIFFISGLAAIATKAGYPFSVVIGLLIAAGLVAAVGIVRH